MSDNCAAMALIKVSQISSENEVSEGKWRHFYIKIVNKYRHRYGAYIWPFDHSIDKASTMFVAMLIL